MRILFWVLVAVDTAVLLLFFVLGLAAAPSARTSGVSVAAYMLVVPSLLLAAAIMLFVRGTSPMARAIALLLVAAPLLLVVVMRGIESAKLALHTNAQGDVAWFREGPTRDVADAIARNDAAAVATLARNVDVNTRGYRNMTLLMLALRQLERPPHGVDSVRALLAAGAKPNLATDELPLEVAIRQSRHAGSEPALMLLKAGANPNTKNQFGTPGYFAATGAGMSVELLDALVAHGADLKATDGGGRTVLFQAATSPNWRAALWLLQHGVDSRQGRSVNGLTFKDMVESHARVYGDTGGLAEVVRFVHDQNR